MSGAVVKLENKTELVIMQGDLSKLSADERLAYVKNICDSLGLNPLTRPFEYMTFQGKMILYARKECTEQLRKLHGVGITNLEVTVLDGICVARATAVDKDHKTDAATGAVSIEGLKGDAKANAMMKAETKAKRRVTLSICGLGFLDESELETMPGAKPIDENKPDQKKIEQAGKKISDERAAYLSGLVAKFRKIGVSTSMICERYKIKEIGNLDDNEISELVNIGNDISIGKMKIGDYFKKV